MTTISDVFNFAVDNSEYWGELVSDEPLPPELNSEETAAVAAARAHVTDAVVELLQACGDAFSDAVGVKSVPRKKFQRAKAIQNRGVWLPPPPGDSTLYGFWFTLEDGGDNKVKLYGALDVKAASSDAIKTRLKRDNMEFNEDRRALYGTGFEIKKDDDVKVLAEAAGKQLAALYQSAAKA